MSIDLLDFVADDRHVISYRPRWNEMTGSITGTILLQQIIYRWVGNGRKPFYKFTQPCNHRAYRPGDSWCEELGMSKNEFAGARKAFAVPTRGNLDAAAIASYWQDGGRKTWYALNEAALIERLCAIYPTSDTVGVQGVLPILKSGNRGVLDVLKSGNSSHPTAGNQNGQYPLLPEIRTNSTELLPEIRTEGVSVLKSGNTYTKNTKDKEDNKNKEISGGHFGEIWQQALGELKLQMTKATYDAWFPNSQLTAIDDGTAVIEVATQHGADWINNRLAGVVSQTLTAVAGQELTVYARPPLMEKRS